MKAIRVPPSWRGPSVLERIIAAGAVAAALVVLIAFGRYTADAFFLFDDFALVDLASSHNLGQFTSAPFIGFYRPAGFWFLRLLFGLFQWTHPAGYAGAALAVHLLNAGLVFGLARALGYGRAGSPLAALAFFAYGPAAEAVFWSSAVFDRLATCGLLIALVAAVTVGRASGRRVAGGVVIALGGLSLSVLAKETGYVIPAVMGMVMFSAARASRRHVAALVVPCAVAAGMLLLWRGAKMPILDGAYGNWLRLISQASLAHNFGLAFVAGIRPPLPAGWPATLAIGSWAVVWLTSAFRNWRFASALAVSWALLFLPVAWTTLIPGSSAAGRFLYAPAVCSALILGFALDPVRAENMRQRWASLTGQVAGAMVIAVSALSLHYQSLIWRDASHISRATVAQMAEFRDYSGTVYVKNLPFWYEQGPYVIKDYAFRAYYGPEYRAVVRARSMTLTFEDGRSRFAGWVAADMAAVAAPSESDRIVTLQLPLHTIQPQPASMIVEVKAGRGSSVFVAGWALDGAASRGCGVDFVHLYARTTGGGATRQEFVVRAAVQEETPALSAWPRQFRACGWSVRTSLPAGTYELIAYPHDLVIGDFGNAATRPLNGSASPPDH